MKIVNFDVDFNEIEIIPLADWHIGNELTDIELIKETCDYITSKPNVFCLINGDLCDNVTKSSVGDRKSVV